MSTTAIRVIVTRFSCDTLPFIPELDLRYKIKYKIIDFFGFNQKKKSKGCLKVCNKNNVVFRNESI